MNEVLSTTWFKLCVDHHFAVVLRRLEAEDNDISSSNLILGNLCKV